MIEPLYGSAAAPVPSTGPDPTAHATAVFASGSTVEKKALAAEIEARPDRYAPVALYALAANLFAAGAKDDAEFWLYAGQLRARCDTRLWHDESSGARVGEFNQRYGLDVIGYAFNDVAKLGDVLQRVAKWDAATPHHYDRRWPALDAQASEPDALQAMLPTDDWEMSDRQTRDRYLRDFRRATGGDAEDYFSDPKLVALAEAARRGNTAQIDRLIAAGVNVNAVGKEGATVLWFPFRGFNKTGYRRLLDHGANPMLPFGRWGDTVLASAAGRNDPNYLALALDHGISPDAILPNSTPLLYRTLVPGALPCLQLLLHRGAKFELRDAMGNTPLLLAATVNQYEEVAVLIEAGADFRAKNSEGQDLAYFLYNGQMSAERRERRAELVGLLRSKGVKLPVAPDENDRPSVHTFADAAGLTASK